MNINELSLEDVYSDQDYKMRDLSFVIANSVSRGTGFLINTAGVFLSAGHNFKEELDSYRAYYRGNEFFISPILKDYDDDKGADLFIGKLNNFEERIVIPFTLKNSSELSVDHELYICGWNTRENIPGSIEPFGDSIHFLGASSYCHIISNSLSIEDKTTKGIITPRSFRNEFRPLKKYYDTYRGLSGGAVYWKYNIYGIYIGNCFCSSEYIIEKLKDLKIDCCI
ncbi:hypothetical protein DWW91_11295 [Parabacteroides sp. AF17-3]|uniref:hypothetical protein n=1 Tax=Parabacteroides sp. AF17-3 TaxID=2293113 RepID=UPI000EFFB884|nr:hypothetical protein [Parabacteroides sp. AF17-3]RKU69573.1 hypothetical protein DWW91_11295 [Parabacteroides sp. AF17-3]